MHVTVTGLDTGLPVRYTDNMNAREQAARWWWQSIEMIMDSWELSSDPYIGDAQRLPVLTAIRDLLTISLNEPGHYVKSPLDDYEMAVW